MWCKGHLAAGGNCGLKLHDWKHPAFSEVSGFDFLAKLSFYKLKTSTSAVLAFFLGIGVLLVCSISFKRIFSLLLQLQSPILATRCGDEGNHLQVVGEQSDPPRVAAQHIWLHPWGHFLHSLPSIALAQCDYHLEYPTYAPVILN